MVAETVAKKRGGAAGGSLAERLVNGSNFYLGLTSALVSLFPSAAKSLGIIRAAASTADTLINCTRRPFRQF